MRAREVRVVSPISPAADEREAGDVLPAAGARPRPVSPFGAGRVLGRDLGPFELVSGARLAALRVAYRHDGPGPAEAPQVLVIHALTGSADAAGDWWSPLIGPGLALDTDRVGVLSANLLGGRYGTTGPTSPDPATGRAYGAAFPAISTRDQARAHWALLDRLGEDGLALARELAMTTYRSEADFDQRFGRAAEADGTPSIVSYLRYQGEKLVRRFDPDTYRTLVGAMDRHDIGVARGGVGPALARLADHGVRLTGLGISGDILYGPEQVRTLVAAAAAEGAHARYLELQSTKGHDAFLAEWDALAVILRGVLDEALAPRPVVPPRD